MDQLDRALAGDLKPLAGNLDALRQLLEQARAELHARDDMIRNLQQERERLQIVQRQHNNPVNAALDALGQLSPDEQVNVYSTLANAQLDHLRAATHDMRQQALAAASHAARIEAAVHKLADHPDMPRHLSLLLAQTTDTARTAATTTTRLAAQAAAPALEPIQAPFTIPADKAADLSSLFT